MYRRRHHGMLPSDLHLQLLHSHSLSQGLPDPEDIYRTFRLHGRYLRQKYQSVCRRPVQAEVLHGFRYVP